MALSKGITIAKSLLRSFKIHIKNARAKEMKCFPYCEISNTTSLSYRYDHFFCNSIQDKANRTCVCVYMGTCVYVFMCIRYPN